MHSTNISILIVEDEVSHVEAIRRAFSAAEVQADIQSFATLRAYREWSAANPPHIALLDLHLPDGNALEALTFPPEAAPFPILVMTSYGSELIAVEALKAGALDYIVKSSEAFAEMPHRIKRALREWNLLQERERREEVQRKTQHLLTISQRLAHIGSWENELSTGKLSWSDEMYHILGFPAAMPIYLDMALSVFPPDELVRFREAVASAMRGETPYNMDYTIIRYDGQACIIHDEGEVVFDEAGKPVRMFGTTQDITARRQAEMEKEKLQEQLLQAQKTESVGRLAGGVAHDFNNMLGVILGYAEFAMTEISPEKKCFHALQEISKAARRSANLTNQLLAYARKQIVIPIVLDLNDTVSSMFNMLQRLLGEDIDMLWRPASHLWQIKVDPSHIDQIMVNLLVNARDAIDTQGKIMIETDNVVLGEADYAHYIELTPGEYVLLTVRDNGGGMDRETLANIFEPFYTTKEVGKGSGMGLATVYGIVKQNMGNIYVYSEPGQGTTFKIYLPRAEAEAAPSITVEKEETTVCGTETVLLVEDEESLLDLLKDTLEELGYFVLAANTPNDALRLAKEHHGEIRLLISDVVMPGMNGQVLAEQVKVICPRLKCLFMSGHTSDIIAKHGVLEEDIHFIQKPFPLNDLAVKVRQTLK